MRGLIFFKNQASHLVIHLPRRYFSNYEGSTKLVLSFALSVCLEYSPLPSTFFAFGDE